MQNEDNLQIKNNWVLNEISTNHVEFPCWPRTKSRASKKANWKWKTKVIRNDVPDKFPLAGPMCLDASEVLLLEFDK